MRRGMRTYLAALGASALLTAASPATAQPGEVWANIDEVRVVKLSQPAGSFLVGNPSIADISILDADRIAIMGKAFGSTNVVVMDSAGETIENIQVRVAASSNGLLTFSRGSSQVTYSCSHRCERALMPGDDKAAFSEIGEQFKKKDEAASDAADAAAN